MPQARYNWVAAESAVRNALREISAALLHLSYGKRVNVLNDLLAAEAEIVKVRRALSGDEPPTRGDR